MINAIINSQQSQRAQASTKNLLRQVLLCAMVMMIGATCINQAIAQSSDETQVYDDAYRAYLADDMSSAEQAWQQLADQGDVDAQYALAVMHVKNQTGLPSKGKAFELFQKAAKQGHVIAMFNVGVSYWEGVGVEKDRQQALKWWNEAAERGEAGSQYNLALAYYIGESVSTDIGLAAKWSRLASQQGHKEATQLLSYIDKENPQAIDSSKSNSVSQPIAESEQLPTSNTTTASTSSASINNSNTSATANDTTSTASNQSVAQSTSQAATEATPEPAVKRNTYYQTNKETALYSSPNPGRVDLLTLPKGSPVDVIRSTANWHLIRFDSGVKTWIYSRFLNNGTVNASDVRIRPKPSTNNSQSPSLGKYRKGEKLTVVKTEGEWTQVRAGNKIGYWVRKSAIETIKLSNAERQLQWEKMTAQGF